MHTITTILAGIIFFFLPLAAYGAGAEGILVRYQRAGTLRGLTLDEGTSVVRLKIDPEEVDSFVEHLNQDPDVEYAEPDYSLQLAGLPNDPFFSPQGIFYDFFYNLEISQIIASWDLATNCDNVIIAVLDSGIDRDHPDLRDNIWFNGAEIPSNGLDDDNNGYADDQYGYNFYDRNGRIQDLNGHGTAVSGIIGAVGNNQFGSSGICWSAQILPLKIINDAGAGNISDALEAIEYAIAQGARILNLSWSISDGKKSFFLEEALERANEKGVLVVVSAGNQGQDIDINPIYPAAHTLPNMLAVAAHDPEGELLPFSNYGEETVALAAPGIDILTTHHYGGHQIFTGTSAAAPHVSAVAALLLSYHPELTIEEVVGLLVNGVEARTSLNKLVTTSGILNAYSSLSTLQEPKTDPALPDDPSGFNPPDPDETDPGERIQPTTVVGGCSLRR